MCSCLFWNLFWKWVYFTIFLLRLRLLLPILLILPALELFLILFAMWNLWKHIFSLHLILSSFYSGAIYWRFHPILSKLDCAQVSTERIKCWYYQHNLAINTRLRGGIPNSCRSGHTPPFLSFNQVVCTLLDSWHIFELVAPTIWRCFFIALEQLVLFWFWPILGCDHLINLSFWTYLSQTYPSALFIHWHSFEYHL